MAGRRRPIAPRSNPMPRSGARRASCRRTAPASRPERWHRFRTIHQALAPEADDIVIATGDQLQRALRDLGLVHLIYVGFAANICVRFRDYGMHAMRDRGYAPILLRDCTSGIETRETYDGLQITSAVLHDLERWVFTADSQDFIAACGTV